MRNFPLDCSGFFPFVFERLDIWKLSNSFQTSLHITPKVFTKKIRSLSSQQVDSEIGRPYCVGVVDNQLPDEIAITVFLTPRRLVLFRKFMLQLVERR